MEFIFYFTGFVVLISFVFILFVHISRSIKERKDKKVQNTFKLKGDPYQNDDYFLLKKRDIWNLKVTEQKQLLDLLNLFYKESCKSIDIEGSVFSKEKSECVPYIKENVKLSSLQFYVTIKDKVTSKFVKEV